METSRHEPSKAAHQRIATSVASLEALVGAHPEALAGIYRRGTPTDPGELGDTPRGMVLAFVGLEGAHLFLRPLVRAIATRILPWDGVIFDHGGNAGANRIAGRDTLRFRAERGTSMADGADALVLTYEKAPRPLRGLRDELRTIGDGVALGPTYLGERLIAWCGLERRR